MNRVDTEFVVEPHADEQGHECHQHCLPHAPRFVVLGKFAITIYLYQVVPQSDKRAQQQREERNQSLIAAEKIHLERACGRK